MVIARWIEAVQTTKIRCNVTRTQADFGLSTSDADRSVTKARTGQLQVSRAAVMRSMLLSGTRDERGQLVRSV
jgi:hypothetical protein